MENPSLNFNEISKENIIILYTQLQASYAVLLQQNTNLQEKVDDLTDQVKLLNLRLYGKKSEKSKDIPGQMEMDFDTYSFVINEPEKILESEGETAEPSIEQVTGESEVKDKSPSKKKKSSGNKEKILSNVETKREDITISEEKLKELFPKGYKELPSESYKILERIPARWVAKQKVIHIYASKDNDGKIIRANHPAELLNNSFLSSSLISALMNAKFGLGLPLNRISQEYERQGVAIPRQVMAGWMIRISDKYLYPIYEAMHEKSLEAALLHADETPARVAEECKARGSSANAYMWVYYSGPEYGSPPLVIYDYEKSRDAENPRQFLKGYKGILVTDGYQVYHELEDENPEELTIAGCWVHAKRHYSELIKANADKYAKGSAASEGCRRISAIYHAEHFCNTDASPDERLQNRQQIVKPLVDAYFAWVESAIEKAAPNTEIYKALDYSINQKKFLKRFLDNPMIPLDNNAAERCIRKFCVGKHSWHVIGSNRGAKSSAVIISIVQTAILNHLKPYNYLKYVLDEMLKRQIENPGSYPVQDLLPWSPSIPEECRLKQNQKSE